MDTVPLVEGLMDTVLSGGIRGANGYCTVRGHLGCTVRGHLCGGGCTIRAFRWRDTCTV